MSFLKFDEHTRQITVINEAKDIPEIKILCDKDSSKDKHFYSNILSYIYHVYKKNHFFNNLSIDERKQMTCEKFMQGHDYKKYENNSKVKDLIKLYIFLEYSQNEWTYQTIKNNINEIKESINDIPLTKIEIINTKVDVEVPCGKEGKNVKKTVEINKEIRVDNTQERMKALGRLLELEEMEEKFRNIITREKKVKEHNSELSLLESNFFEENKQQ